MTVELVIALGALVVSFLGSALNYYKLKDARKAWEHEQKISLEKEIFFKRLEKRYSLYEKTFSLLGSVRDIEYPTEHHVDLKKNRKNLIETADSLLEELYGEAGLFMEYETRSCILKTYQTSYRYSKGEASLSELIDSYYKARRYLRKDLSFDDSEGTKTTQDILKDKKTEMIEKKHRTEKSMWVEKGMLARSSRPGYPDKNVSLNTLNETVAMWKTQGIKSIVCLLSDNEIRMYYKSINSNLIEFYKAKGFEVFHQSIEDYLNPPVSNDELIEIKSEYKLMTQPVMVHCGAGQDRTGQVVEYITN
ncbi:MAG: tyrosine-protein phosphatase [Porticoccus sp.]|nr:tyrosine-protein phosphatase [Porticoccus sp.]